MTKEELEKEAEEWLCNNLHSASEEDFIKAMIDIAEPREKRIAELEKRCNELFFQVNEKTERIADLEKENAELKEKLEVVIALKDEEIGCIQTDFNTFKSKAKELLKKVLDLKKVVTKTEEYLLLEEAEQFLSEVEK